MVTFDSIIQRRGKIAVVGLGYVGLPLAAAFGHKLDVIGFDIDRRKLNQLRDGLDMTGELSSEQLAATRIDYTDDPARLAEARFVIVPVPTPIDGNKKPDLRPIEEASRTIGQNLARGSIVVYESTVYPGVTEEVAVPILEAESGLQCGVDFKVGYSPERINPGDKVHTVDKIVKVVSGQDAETLETVAAVYELIVTAGVHRASSIKVAEAAKVIENTQRDLNIALMNELAIIFDRLGISTREVLAAAGTKWNFLPFTPGLVGGHCIGVDPYYLTHKAESIGYHPQVILAGRRINDGMGKFVAEQMVKKLIRADKTVKGARVLVLGLTFKENCHDIRNTKVVDIVAELREYGVEVLVHDPMADPGEAQHEYGLDLVDLEDIAPVDGVVWAVAHRAFADITPKQLKDLCGNGNGSGVVMDVKGVLARDEVEKVGMQYWSL
ncbi:UDP-N-acetyl-D-galactosamine dehydrogenase [Geothermobacter ehrlichii]|uniref:UDP-N-acetyl-D-galactosamine dehydrogenase n=1 Tax=Geothermobacter ehrlichii TaxID=213224 RepID=A0A5D3WHP9_9BACT|nr:nucleotide sugar dehydrogenase [Geothermobacter ehrlichii]TYO98369.1 UDP-N-acetyl-D-galactosamine dehydrogenase [Geothermobacter ehrlichii]